MSVFTQQILAYDVAYKKKLELKDKVEQMTKQLSDMNMQLVVMLEAQRLLATVSEDNTTAVLDYITGVINKALAELFPYDKPRIFLEKKLHAGQHAHILVRLENSEGKMRDLVLQTGTGQRQVISFLFVISLIEIRKGRRLLIMDELLSGLHPEAKTIVTDIMKIFAEGGFQFVMVEYGVNNLGKIYLVERPSKIAYVNALEGEYNNEVFLFNRPAEEVDKNIYVDEEE